jgi:ABC-2 type transport system ATP-binding protein
MDEAERCHALAYLAYGRLMVNGSAANVVAHSGLSTWAVSGPDGALAMQQLAQALRGAPGVQMVVPFGTTLHVSGDDAEALEVALAPYRARDGLTWTRTEPSLEDVFIGLMNRAQDNYA